MILGAKPIQRTSKQEEGSSEQQEQVGSGQEAEETRHCPNDHQNDAERQQDDNCPMHVWGKKMHSITAW